MMEVTTAIFVLLFLPPALSMHLETVSFHNFLEAFRDCSITYYHLARIPYSSMASWQGVTILSEKEWINELKDKFGSEVVLQFKIIYSLTSNTPSIPPAASSFFKFSVCRVMIFRREYVSYSLNVFTSTKYPEVLHDFIWFLGSDIHMTYLSYHTTMKIPYNSYINLVKSHKPAIYMEIEKFNRVFLVCLPCWNLSNPYAFMVVPLTVQVSPSDRLRIMSVRKMWTNLHSNMHGVYIGLYFTGVSDRTWEYFHPGQPTPCSPYPRRTKFHSERICSVILLSVINNFTLSPAGNTVFDHLFPFVKVLHSEIYTTRTLVPSNLWSIKAQGEVVSTYGMQVQHFEFVVLLDKQLLLNNQVKLNGILAPFPTWIWIAIGKLGCVASLLLFWNQNYFKKWTDWASPRRLITFMSSLVEQPVPTFTWKKKLSNLQLWFTWCSFCLVISHAYRAFLFSSLTTDVTPATPESLEELAASQILIGTIEDSFQYNLLGIPTQFSTLKGSILPDILILYKDHDAGKFYTKLRNSVVWFHDNLILLSVEASINKIVKSRTHWFPIPGEFAIIDTRTTIRRLKILFDEIGVYWISKPLVEPILATRMMWTAKYNYFSPIFFSQLSKVIESGLYDRWERFGSVYADRAGKRKVQESVKKETTLSVKPQYEEHEISRSVYIEILVHFCALLGVAVFIFSLEMYLAYQPQYGITILAYRGLVLNVFSPKQSGV